MRVLEMTGTRPEAVACSVAVREELKQFCAARNIPLVNAVSGNSWRGILPGLGRAIALVAKHWDKLFVVWAHHSDSNRWLQVVLAASGRRFVVAERLVPENRSDFAHSRLSIPLKRFIAPRAQVTVLNGYSQPEHYRAVFGLRQARLAVVPNTRRVGEIHERVLGLRRDKDELRASLRLPAGPLVLSVGRLDSQKDQKTLIQAVGEIGGIHLVLVGDGDDRPELEKLARQVAAGRVFFAGYHADPLPFLAVADLFAFPSLFEGLPGALIEAMAAELPCVATHVPGNSELLSNMVTGLTVPVRGAVEMCRALQWLVDHPTDAARLARAGYEWVLERYDEWQEQSGWRRVLESAED